jgi:hypothetical protein
MTSVSASPTGSKSGLSRFDQWCLDQSVSIHTLTGARRHSTPQTQQPGALNTDDLDFLQDVYEAATADIANVDNATMHETVKMLIMYYRASERDKAKLAVVAT